MSSSISALHSFDHVNGPWITLPAPTALHGKDVELAAGEVVYEPTTPARNLYFLKKGQVRTYEAGPHESARMLEILGPGDWFGEAALANADAHSSRAVAAAPTTLEVVSVKRLTEILSTQPTAAMDLIGQLAKRLLAAREDANQFVFDDCKVRLIKALLRFSRTAAATPQDDGAVVLRITHQQLALAVGAARETVSLALTQLRQQDLLHTGRNQLQFRPAALECFVHAQPAGQPATV